MTEALKIAPQELEGESSTFSTPNFIEIPFHLTRAELRRKQREIGENKEMHILWGERAGLTEKKVQLIIASQTQIVERVVMNPPDTQGSDLTVFFNKGFAVKKAYIEVKSSKKQINKYKEEYKEKLPENEKTIDDVRRHMTNHNIILINGGARGNTDIEITREEILNDSFYPQLERILANVSQNQNGDKPTQLFP